MPITEERKEFLTFLKHSMQDTEKIIGVALLTRTFEQEKQLYRYIRTNPKVTDEEVLEKAIEIHQTIK